MGTRIINVPVGAPQIAFLNQPGGVGSVCAQPGVGGTVLLEWSYDGVTWQAAPEGASLTTYALGASTAGATPNPGGAGPAFPYYARVRCTAGTAAAVMLVSDVSQVSGGVTSGGGSSGGVVLQSGVAYLMNTSAAEQKLIALRFPAGLLKPNFTIEVTANVKIDTSADDKTVKGYFGNTGAGTSIGAFLATTATEVNETLHWMISGRGDGATVVGSSVNVTGGWGPSTTAGPLITSNANYLTTEQELYFTGLKATAADVLQLDQIIVRLLQ